MMDYLLEVVSTLTVTPTHRGHAKVLGNSFKGIITELPPNLFVSCKLRFMFCWDRVYFNLIHLNYPNKMFVRDFLPSMTNISFDNLFEATKKNDYLFAN